MSQFPGLSSLNLFWCENQFVPVNLNRDLFDTVQRYTIDIVCLSVSCCLRLVSSSCPRFPFESSQIFVFVNFVLLTVFFSFLFVIFISLSASSYTFSSFPFVKSSVLPPIPVFVWCVCVCACPRVHVQLPSVYHQQ